MTNKIVLAYLVYLPLALGLTLYVARTLFRNGRVFMLDIFKGRTDIADSTNKLFETGFYLMNIGFAMLILKVDQGVIMWSGTDTNGVPQLLMSNPLNTNQALVEVLASKLGGFAIYLGFMLFLNLYLFFRGRRKARAAQAGVTIGPIVTA